MGKILAILAGLALQYGPKLLEYGKEAASMGGAVIVAAITAIPGVLMGLAAFLKAVAESSLLSFLLAAAMFGPVCFWLGIKQDAPLRERARIQAVHAANIRVDLVLARQRTLWDAEVAQLKKQLATKSGQKIAKR